MKAPYIQYSTTGTGGTINIVDTQDEVQVIHETALVALLTIAMPPTPVDGQRIYISTVGGITGLTITAAQGSLASNLTTLVAGGIAAYMYRATTNKWYKVR